MFNVGAGRHVKMTCFSRAARFESVIARVAKPSAPQPLKRVKPSLSATAVPSSETSVTSTIKDVIVAEKPDIASSQPPLASVKADDAAAAEEPVSTAPATTEEHEAGSEKTGIDLAPNPSPEAAKTSAQANEDGTEESATMKVKVAKATAEITREIVFVTSEVAPYSKTGGLGDVCGSLPQALAARGHRVMVVAPAYADYEGVVYSGNNAEIEGETVGYHHKHENGVDLVFVDHPSYRRPGGLYGDSFGTYGDNQWRFKLLCLAALEAPLQLPLGEKGLYGQDCIFVANDWFAGLVPVYLAARYRSYGVYLGARAILAIHNLRHQGVFPPGTFADLGLPDSWYGCMEWQYPPHLRQGAYEEEGRAVNTMKAAISSADRIVTVSPGYAYEIQTNLGGWGMEFLLGGRQYALNGILNGIDENEWNPETDKHLPFHYSKADLSGKAKCKAALQQELGLPVRDDVPLIAFIGRLDYQKGADLVLAAAPWMMEHGCQLVCLGTGDSGLEDGLRYLESNHNSQARGWVGFNVPFSHRLTAAADILLMPSRFEPCGLNQLYAMRYGTVPVAHATGGLRDTVINYDQHKPEGTTGWVFSPCDADALKGATWNALQTYWTNKEAWRGLMKRGMERDCSWDKAAEQYEQIFTWAKTDLPYCG